MGFTDILKKSFPFLSAAASLGGPLGTMAAAAVGKALGLDKPPAGTSDSISNAIALAMADPAQRAAILEAERQFQLQMAELGYKDAEELAAIAAKDRDSARNREIQVKDKMPAILGLSVTVGFFSLVGLMAFHPFPEQTKDVFLILVGALTVGWKDVMGYYLGSSAGSDRKTDLLAQAGTKVP